jgi:hypothetical protein
MCIYTSIPHRSRFSSASAPVSAIQPASVSACGEIPYRLSWKKWFGLGGEPSGWHATQVRACGRRLRPVVPARAPDARENFRTGPRLRRRAEALQTRETAAHRGRSPAAPQRRSRRGYVVERVHARAPRRPRAAGRGCSARREALGGARRRAARALCRLKIRTTSESGILK